MSELLGLVLISFFSTAILLVPFIDFLFHLKKKYHSFSKPSHILNLPIHNKLLAGKDIETPVGGGLLLIPVVVILSILISYFTSGKLWDSNLRVLLFTLLSFGLIGAWDDFRKIVTSFSGKYSGLRGRYLIVLQFVFGLVAAYLLYHDIGLANIYIPIIGNIVLGLWYIPLAAFIIVSFANAYNISDGLDGLSTGLLAICLFAFLSLAHTVFNPTLSVFVGLWIGALIAYLYFNVYPARIYLGDAGAFGFGATLAVVGLLTGKIIGLGVIGGMYVVIILSSAIQMTSKTFLKRKVFPVAPIHMYFKYIGWSEPKIVTRFWLAGAMCAIFGLWLSVLSK